jgi:hypothetical protein
VRLCLDEHYAIRIAVELRARGQDVVAVKERPELQGVVDWELMAAIRAEHSALLTENVSDFMPIVQELAVRGEDHWGVVFSSPVSMPRGTGTIGAFVSALNQLLVQRSAEDGLLNQVWWLQPRE